LLLMTQPKKNTFAGCLSLLPPHEHRKGRAERERRQLTSRLTEQNALTRKASKPV